MTAAMDAYVKTVMDAVDVETVLAVPTEAEGRRVASTLLQSWGFSDVSVVFAQSFGAGVRVRARAYVYRPGDRYEWLRGSDDNA